MHEIQQNIFLILLNSVSKMPLGGGQGAPRWWYATGPAER
jgi:hypothetical protein